jgi:hypothetical protein
MLRIMSKFYSGYFAFGVKDYSVKRISVPNKSTSKNEANQIKKCTGKLKLSVIYVIPLKFAREYINRTKVFIYITNGP